MYNITIIMKNGERLNYTKCESYTFGAFPFENTITLLGKNSVNLGYINLNDVSVMEIFLMEE